MGYYNKAERKMILTKAVKDGLTVEQMMDKICVSKVRVYQLMTEFGLATPERSKKGTWTAKDKRLRWLKHILENKEMTRQEVTKVLDYAEANLETFLPKVCPVLGVPLVYGAEGKRMLNSASVDKLVPAKGYVLENISIISWRANNLKNNASMDEMGKIYAWMQQKTKELD